MPDDEQELRELQDPAAWDDEQGETRQGIKNPRAVVSVAFSAPELGEVATYARQHGMKTSEFIRGAALEHVRRPMWVVQGFTSFGTGYRMDHGASTSATPSNVTLKKAMTQT